MKHRFITVTTNGHDSILCLSEMEYFRAIRDHGNLDDYCIHKYGDGYSDYVWQWAENKENAISLHFVCLDKWEEDPTKTTYAV